MSEPILLAMNGISKSFPGVRALDSVGLEVARAEVVALVGENGAGKSTLMKILAGIEQPDAGAIRIDGEPVELRSPRDAAVQGIAIIHQELELIDTLDVAANVFLGREPSWCGAAKFMDVSRMRAETEKALCRLGASISARAVVGTLSLAQQQLVEIARALSLNAKALLMDEPTSSLTASETERLLGIVRELRSQGVSIVYVSHRLREVEAVADRAVVLRDGRNAGELKGPEITADSMIRLMVGRDLKSYYGASAGAATGAAFEVQGFRTRRYPGSEVSLAIRGGEVLGLAGLVGAGRSELAQAVFGAEPPLSGSIRMEGRRLKISSPADAIGCGIYLVPEDRRRLGLITGMSVRENITITALRRHSFAGLLRRRSEDAAARKMCDALQVKASSLETPASHLSGGNQQKVVLAKWLALKPRLILFDEPTRGIDVGARAEIYQIIRKLAEAGVAILMISSDMEEIIGNSDRVAVMRDGKITGVLDRSECSQETIMRLAVA